MLRAIFFAAILCIISTVSYGQNLFENTRVSSVVSYHTTVDTTTALAIPAANVTGDILSFKICNDAVNTSTYLLVGQAADVSTDGTMLDKGQCYVCENCKPSVLKALKVEGQAASNGYSVIQYKR